MKNIPISGLIISIAGFIFFVLTFFNLIGWYTIIVSPIVTLCVLRPVKGGTKWAWHK